MTSCVFIFTTPFQLNRAKGYIWWISTTGGIRTRTCRILSSIPLPLGYCGIWCGDVRNQPPRLVFCPYFCYTRLIAPIASISLVYTTDFSTDSGSRTHTVFLPSDFKSDASAYSAIPAYQASCSGIEELHPGFLFIRKATYLVSRIP